MQTSDLSINTTTTSSTTDAQRLYSTPTRTPGRSPVSQHSPVTTSHIPKSNLNTTITPSSMSKKSNTDTINTYNGGAGTAGISTIGGVDQSNELNDDSTASLFYIPSHLLVNIWSYIGYTEQNIRVWANVDEHWAQTLLNHPQSHSLFMEWYHMYYASRIVARGTGTIDDSEFQLWWQQMNSKGQQQNDHSLNFNTNNTNQQLNPTTRQSRSTSINQLTLQPPLASLSSPPGHSPHSNNTSGTTTPNTHNHFLSNTSTTPSPTSSVYGSVVTPLSGLVSSGGGNHTNRSGLNTVITNPKSIGTGVIDSNNINNNVPKSKSKNKPSIILSQLQFYHSKFKQEIVTTACINKQRAVVLRRAVGAINLLYYNVIIPKYCGCWFHIEQRLHEAKQDITQTKTLTNQDVDTNDPDTKTDKSSNSGFSALFFHKLCSIPSPLLPPIIDTGLGNVTNNNIPSNNTDDTLSITTNTTTTTTTAINTTTPITPTQSLNSQLDQEYTSIPLDGSNPLDHNSNTTTQPTNTIINPPISPTISTSPTTKPTQPQFDPFVNLYLHHNKFISGSDSLNYIPTTSPPNNADTYAMQHVYQLMNRSRDQAQQQKYQIDDLGYKWNDQVSIPLDDIYSFNYGTNSGLNDTNRSNHSPNIINCRTNITNDPFKLNKGLNIDDFPPQIIPYLSVRAQKYTISTLKLQTLTTISPFFHSFIEFFIALERKLIYPCLCYIERYSKLSRQTMKQLEKQDKILSKMGEKGIYKHNDRNVKLSDKIHHTSGQNSPYYLSQFGDGILGSPSPLLAAMGGSGDIGGMKKEKVLSKSGQKKAEKAAAKLAKLQEKQTDSTGYGQMDDDPYGDLFVEIDNGSTNHKNNSNLNKKNTNANMTNNYVKDDLTLPKPLITGKNRKAIRAQKAALALDDISTKHNFDEKSQDFALELEVPRNNLNKPQSSWLLSYDDTSTRVGNTTPLHTTRASSGHRDASDVCCDDNKCEQRSGGLNIAGQYDAKSVNFDLSANNNNNNNHDDTNDIQLDIDDWLLQSVEHVHHYSHGHIDCDTICTQFDDANPHFLNKASTAFNKNEAILTQQHKVANSNHQQKRVHFHNTISESASIDAKTIDIPSSSNSNPVVRFKDEEFDKKGDDFDGEATNQADCYSGDQQKNPSIITPTTTVMASQYKNDKTGLIPISYTNEAYTYLHYLVYTSRTHENVYSFFSPERYKLYNYIENPFIPVSKDISTDPLSLSISTTPSKPPRNDGRPWRKRQQAEPSPAVKDALKQQIRETIVLPSKIIRNTPINTPTMSPALHGHASPTVSLTTGQIQDIKDPSDATIPSQQPLPSSTHHAMVTTAGPPAVPSSRTVISNNLIATPLATIYSALSSTPSLTSNPSDGFNFTTIGDFIFEGPEVVNSHQSASPDSTNVSEPPSPEQILVPLDLPLIPRSSFTQDDTVISTEDVDIDVMRSNNNTVKNDDNTDFQSSELHPSGQLTTNTSIVISTNTDNPDVGDDHVDFDDIDHDGEIDVVDHNNSEMCSGGTSQLVFTNGDIYNLVLKNDFVNQDEEFIQKFLSFEENNENQPGLLGLSQTFEWFAEVFPYQMELKQPNPTENSSKEEANIATKTTNASVEGSCESGFVSSPSDNSHKINDHADINTIDCSNPNTTIINNTLPPNNNISIYSDLLHPLTQQLQYLHKTTTRMTITAFMARAPVLALQLQPHNYSPFASLSLGSSSTFRTWDDQRMSLNSTKGANMTNYANFNPAYCHLTNNNSILPGLIFASNNTINVVQSLDMRDIASRGMDNMLRNNHNNNNFYNEMKNTLFSSQHSSNPTASTMTSPSRSINSPHHLHSPNQMNRVSSPYIGASKHTPGANPTGGNKDKDANVNNNQSKHSFSTQKPISLLTALSSNHILIAEDTSVSIYDISGVNVWSVPKKLRHNDAVTFVGVTFNNTINTFYNNEADNDQSNNDDKASQHSNKSRLQDDSGYYYATPKKQDNKHSKKGGKLIRAHLVDDINDEYFATFLGDDDDVDDHDLVLQQQQPIQQHSSGKKGSKQKKRDRHGANNDIDLNLSPTTSLSHNLLGKKIIGRSSSTNTGENDPLSENVVKRLHNLGVNTVITASLDGTIKMYDVENTAIIATLTGQSNKVYDDVKTKWYYQSTDDYKNDKNITSIMNKKYDQTNPIHAGLGSTLNTTTSVKRQSYLYSYLGYVYENGTTLNTLAKLHRHKYSYRHANSGGWYQLKLYNKQNLSLQNSTTTGRFRHYVVQQPSNITNHSSQRSNSNSEAQIAEDGAVVMDNDQLILPGDTNVVTTNANPVNYQYETALSYASSHGGNHGDTTNTGKSLISVNNDIGQITCGALLSHDVLITGSYISNATASNTSGSNKPRGGIGLWDLRQGQCVHFFNDKRNTENEERLLHTNNNGVKGSTYGGTGNSNNITSTTMHDTIHPSIAAAIAWNDGEDDSYFIDNDDNVNNFNTFVSRQQLRQQQYQFLSTQSEHGIGYTTALAVDSSYSDGSNGSSNTTNGVDIGGSYNGYLIWAGFSTGVVNCYDIRRLDRHITSIDLHLLFPQQRLNSYKSYRQGLLYTQRQYEKLSSNILYSQHSLPYTSPSLSPSLNAVSPSLSPRLYSSRKQHQQQYHNGYWLDDVINQHYLSPTTPHLSFSSQYSQQNVGNPMSNIFSSCWSTQHLQQHYLHTQLHFQKSQKQHNLHSARFNPYQHHNSTMTAHYGTMASLDIVQNATKSVIGTKSLYHSLSRHNTPFAIHESNNPTNTNHNLSSFNHNDNHFDDRFHGYSRNNRFNLSPHTWLDMILSPSQYGNDALYSTDIKCDRLDISPDDDHYTFVDSDDDDDEDDDEGGDYDNISSSNSLHPRCYYDAYNSMTRNVLYNNVDVIYSASQDNNGNNEANITLDQDNNGNSSSSSPQNDFEQLFFNNEDDNFDHFYGEMKTTSSSQWVKSRSNKTSTKNAKKLSRQKTSTKPQSSSSLLLSSLFSNDYSTVDPTTYVANILDPTDCGFGYNNNSSNTNYSFGIADTIAMPYQRWSDLHTTGHNDTTQHDLYLLNICNRSYIATKQFLQHYDHAAVSSFSSNYSSVLQHTQKTLYSLRSHQNTLLLRFEINHFITKVFALLFIKLSPHIVTTCVQMLIECGYCYDVYTAIEVLWVIMQDYSMLYMPQMLPLSTTTTTTLSSSSIPTLGDSINAMFNDDGASLPMSPITTSTTTTTATTGSSTGAAYQSICALHYDSSINRLIVLQPLQLSIFHTNTAHIQHISSYSPQYLHQLQIQQQHQSLLQQYEPSQRESNTSSLSTNQPNNNTDVSIVSSLSQDAYGNTDFGHINTITGNTNTNNSTNRLTMSEQMNISASASNNIDDNDGSGSNQHKFFHCLSVLSSNGSDGKGGYNNQTTNAIACSVKSKIYVLTDIDAKY